MNEPSSVLLRGPGLWEKVSAKGRRYMSGRLGPLKIVIFENTRRGEPGQPDWQMSFGEAPPWKGPEQKGGDA